MYSELEEQAVQAFLELAKRRYKDFVKEDGEIDMAWVLALLAAYDPVTKYVFEHEVERKRARMAEAVIASENKTHELLLARNLWMRQVKQYCITLEDAAVLAAYAALGIKEVQWVAEKDDRVCKICKARDGKVYPLAAVPTKPHYNCRCYLLPVKGMKR